ncbi:amino acid adenylation domain-containing protein [Lysinibacillus sp. NPDC093692]|uniref:amino acid adenylation domain-containing protein n=1 Tax=Lysinibacillus sp. NPDC093692 TaxID=3390578 RepID=UPI003D073EB3
MAKAYRMSDSQKRIFVLEQLLENSTVYNIPMMLEIEGNIDSLQLERALNELTIRQELLRTYFVNHNENFLQIIEERCEANFSYLEAKEEQVTRLYEKFVRPFDMNKAPLFRVQLIKINPEKSMMFFDIHHSICDGGSVDVLIKELECLYNGNTLPELTIQYKNYSAWKHKQNLNVEKEYWFNELEGRETTLDLNHDYLRPANRNFVGNNLKSIFEIEQTEAIRKIADETNATEFMVLLSAFMFFLSKVSMGKNVTVGFPVSGRTHPDTLNMLGMFVNTLVIHHEIPYEETFQTLIQEIRQKCLNAYSYQEYPFDELVDELNVPRDPSRNPLFDVLFSVSEDNLSLYQLGEAKMKPVETEYKNAKFDLTVNLCLIDGAYHIYWEYAAELFKPETIECLNQRFQFILKELLTNKETILKDIRLCSTEDLEQIESLNGFSDLEKYQNLNALFDQQVRENPDKTALVFRKNELSYKELDQRVMKAAVALKNKGIEPGQYVSFISTKDIESIIIMLAVVRIGAAYVPIDPKYPEKRVQTIVTDSGSDYLIVIDHKVSEFSFIQGAEIIAASDLETEPMELSDLEIETTLDSMAYMIYTSGTTGTPKGVMITHRNIIRLVKDTDYVDFKDVRLLQTGSLAFDAATFEVWGTLLNGMTLFLAEEDALLDVDKFHQIIDEYQINTLWLTSSLFNEFVSLKSSFGESVKQLLIGGENLSVRHVKKFISHNPTIKLINGYGPTETTTFALTNEITKAEGLRIPIGKPIGNTEVYIMQDEQICPVGIKGEICIGGQGVSRGYWNRPEMTANSFVSHPFKPNEQLYRTGDLGFINSDGKIECIGRKDKQIKLRGFRIELAEIEKELLQISNIREAAVILSEIENTPILCAYIVCEETVTENIIKAELHKRLPDYMIPSQMIMLETLPKTINGKLDSIKLPKPSLSMTEAFVAPRNEQEVLIADVFKEIFSLEKVSINDSFIDLGGDSIKAIKVVSKVREQGYKILVSDILSLKRVEGIAQALMIEQEVKYAQGTVSGKVNLTPIQKTFFKRKMTKQHYFNQSLLIEADEKVDCNILRAVLNSLVKHHDNLRSTFKNEEQVIHDFTEERFFDLQVIDLRKNDAWKEELIYQAERIKSSINLESGLLFKIGLIYTDDKTFLLFSFHHLVMDAVSLRILFEDFQNAYATQKKGASIVLPKKTASFIDWSNYLENEKNETAILKTKDYWTQVESQLIHAELPVAQEIDADTSFDCSIVLNKEDTKKLLTEICHKTGAEMQHLLMTAVAKAVGDAGKQKKVALNLEGHGREILSKPIETDRTVGWFTSVYPIIFDFSKQEVLQQQIGYVKDVFEQVPHGGVSYGLTVNGEVEEPFADITFNYLGEMERSETKQMAFVLSDLEHGRDISEENSIGGALDITAVLFEGKMHINFYPNKDKWKNILLLKRIIQAASENLQEMLTSNYSNAFVEQKRSISEKDSIILTLSKYKRKTVLYTLCTEEKEYTLLFIENLTYELKQEIQQYLFRNVEISKIPDFILQSKDMTWLSPQMNEKEFRQFIYEHLFEAEKESDNITDQVTKLLRVEETFKPTVLQRYYLEDVRKNIKETIHVVGAYTKEQIIEAIQLICSHENILRSAYDGEQLIVYPSLSNIDFISRTSYQGDVEDYLNQVVENYPIGAKSNTKIPLLCKFVIIQHTEKHYDIHFIGCHSVWDKTSTVLFHRKILNILEMNEPQQSGIAGFRDYAEEIRDKQPLSYQKEIEGRIQFVEEYLSKFDKIPEFDYCTVFTIKMGAEVERQYQKSPWLIIQKIISEIIKINFSSDDIPVFLLQEDRQQLSGDYQGRIGPFLDLLPLTINQSKELEEEISLLQSIKKEEKINYLELMASRKLHQTDLIEKVPTVNFQGVFELDYDSFLLFSQMTTNLVSMEIYINNYADNLLVSLPVRKNEESLVKNCLDNLMDDLEKRFIANDKKIYV